MSPLLSVKNKWVGLSTTPTCAEFAKLLCAQQNGVMENNLEIYEVKMGATKCRMTTLFLKRPALCGTSAWYHHDKII